MRWVGLVAAFAMVPGVCGAAPSTVIGGTDSCGKWLATPSMDRDVKAWVAGFFTGMNEASSTNRDVGEKTDIDGIIGEVRLLCQQDPSAQVGLAAYRAYQKLKAVGR